MAMVSSLVAAAVSVVLLAAPQTDDAVFSITIERLPSDYQLDGRLSEWAEMRPVRLDSPNLVRGAEWRGASDLSARVWFAWDDTSFYFAADIIDDDYLGCPRSRPLWDSDALMISLRFPGRTGMGREGETFFLLVSENGGKPLGRGLSGSRGRYDAFPLPSMQLEVVPRERTGPRLEGSVSWADFLGPGCAPPQMLQINLEARDVDAEGRLKSISWIPAAERSPGEPSFGLALLLRPAELEGLVRRRAAAGYVEFVHLVFLPVVVTDSANNYVLDLEEDDFVVFEDGREQTIESFRYETRPITVGLLIDSSGSMEKSIDGAKRAAVSFLESIREEDRCFAISFNHNIELIKDLEGDTESAIDAIEKINAEGGTYLYSAIHFALGKLRFLNEKKVLVLLSDGKDESLGESLYGQEISFDYVLEEAKRQEVIVYAIAYRMNDAKAIGEFHSLVRQTGGRIFTPNAVDGLIEAYAKIADDLKSQYLLSYVSNNNHWDGRWRSITVRVKGKNYKVRTRPGYYAPRR